jgi:hypothetical protein
LEIISKLLDNHPIQPQDFIMKEIQRLLYALVKKAFDILELTQTDDQDEGAARMQAILEEATGLEMNLLEKMPTDSLTFLLRLRAQGESRTQLKQIFSIQAELAKTYPAFGNSIRWQQIRIVLDALT